MQVAWPPFGSVRITTSILHHTKRMRLELCIKLNCLNLINFLGKCIIFKVLNKYIIK